MTNEDNNEENLPWLIDWVVPYDDQGGSSGVVGIYNTKQEAFLAWKQVLWDMNIERWPYAVGETNWDYESLSEFSVDTWLEEAKESFENGFTTDEHTSYTVKRYRGEMKINDEELMIKAYNLQKEIKKYFAEQEQSE